jgi:hypothetical protein
MCASGLKKIHKCLPRMCIMLPYQDMGKSDHTSVTKLWICCIKSFMPEHLAASLLLNMGPRHTQLTLFWTSSTSPLVHIWFLVSIMNVIFVAWTLIFVTYFFGDLWRKSCSNKTSFPQLCQTVIGGYEDMGNWMIISSTKFTAKWPLY